LNKLVNIPALSDTALLNMTTEKHIILNLSFKSIIK